MYNIQCLSSKSFWWAVYIFLIWSGIFPFMNWSRFIRSVSGSCFHSIMWCMTGSYCCNISQLACCSWQCPPPLSPHAVSSWDCHIWPWGLNYSWFSQGFCPKLPSPDGLALCGSECQPPCYQLPIGTWDSCWNWPEMWPISVQLHQGWV